MLPSGRCQPQCRKDPKTQQVRNTKRFYILNPTNIGYEFEWTCADANSGRGGAFSCMTKKGTVLSGKKFEIVFEYTPEADQMQESLWKFEIAEQGIVVPFLLVGHVLEPKVVARLLDVKIEVMSVISVILVMIT